MNLSSTKFPACFQLDAQPPRQHCWVGWIDRSSWWSPRHWHHPLWRITFDITSLHHFIGGNRGMFFLPIIYPGLRIEWPHSVIPILPAHQHTLKFGSSLSMLKRSSPFLWFIPEPSPAHEFVFELTMFVWSMVMCSCHLGTSFRLV